MVNDLEENKDVKNIVSGRKSMETMNQTDKHKRIIEF